MPVAAVQNSREAKRAGSWGKLLDSERAPAVLLGLMLVLYLSPLAWILVPPTQDGPSHLSIANTLRHLLLHDRPRLERYFEINWFPEPNLVGHVVLSWLLGAVSPFAAEKILFGSYVAALPLAAYYAIRSVNGRAPAWLVLLVVPFTWSKMMQVGFYNFCLSLPVFYVCLGYFIRAFPKLNAWRAALLGLLILVLYFSHAMSVAMLFVAMAVMVPWMIFEGKRSGFWPRLAWLAAAWVPTAALLAAFVYRYRGGESSYAVSLVERVMRLAVLSSLVTHRRIEIAGSMGLLLVFAVLTASYAAARIRPFKIEAGDVFLLLAGIFLAIFFVIPDVSSGGSAHTQRAELYPFLVLPLWFAAQPPLVRRKRTIAMGLAAAVALVLWGLNISQLRKTDTAVREYYSVASHIQPGKTLLPIVLDRYGHDAQGEPLSMRCQAFFQAAGRLNPVAGAIELVNYQASSPGFVVRYRREVPDWTLLRPAQMWDKFGEELGRGELSGDPDYVLIYGWDPDRIKRNPDFRDIAPERVLESLEHGYVLEFVSSPEHAVRLYRRRETV